MTIGVLFVCTANTCRSPMAEGVFRTLVRRAGLEVGLKIPTLATEKTAAFYVNRMLRSEAPANRQAVFEIVRGNAGLATNLEIVSVVSEALTARQVGALTTAGGSTRSGRS